MAHKNNLLTVDAQSTALAGLQVATELGAVATNSTNVRKW